jgi:hypothetical protein
MVVIEDETTRATDAEWDETRSALLREGVRVDVRGPTGDIRLRTIVPPPARERRGCEPLPPLVEHARRPIPQVKPE